MVHTPSASLDLRPYQREALGAVAAAEQRGVRRTLVALPTGTGKTVIFSHLIHARGGRALVLAHRDELLGQAADKLTRVDPATPVGLVRAELDQVHAPIIAASIQTLARDARLARLGTDFHTIVVDEAHHAAAPTYRRVLEHLGAFEDAGPLVVGFTATPERGDRVGLGCVFEEIVYRRTLLDMLRAGYLCDLRAVQVTLEADLSQVRVRGGDFAEGELAAALLEANAPEHVAEALGEHAAGRKMLVFVPGVELAYETAGALCAAGIRAEALDGTTPRDERWAILARLRSGQTRAVVNCAVLTEGFDEPSVNCVVVARPTKSAPLYTQMIGRGTRMYPGKADCLILDLVGASTRHELVTAATLIGLAPCDLAGGRLVSEAVTEREARGYDIADGRLVSRAVDLFDRHALHWVTDGGRFSLSLGDGMLVLQEVASGWQVLRLGHGGTRQVVASGLDLGYAQGIAEDLVREAKAAALVDPNARWRHRPATPKQLDTLRRMRVRVDGSLSAGRASELIGAAIARRGAA